MMRADASSASRARARAGSVTVITGCMFSGKTEELLRLVRRAMHARRSVLVVKSALDTRAGTEIVRTHDGLTFAAIPVTTAADIERALPDRLDVLGIEEIQFLDERVVDLCQSLADRGVDVIAAGLDQDFRGAPFGFMPTLLSLAENVLKLHAICKVCGADATRTQRLIDGRPAAWDDPIILIGAEEAYEARCRRCHTVRRRPRHAGTATVVSKARKPVTPRLGPSLFGD